VNRITDIIKSLSAEPSVIVHIGAGSCGENDLYQSLGTSKVVYVEPDPYFAETTSSTFESLPGTKVIPCAIATENGRQKLNITNNRRFSSLLLPDGLLEFYPNIVVDECIDVETKTLTKLCQEEEIHGESDGLLVVELQGLEKEVFPTVEVDTLQRFKWILIRSSNMNLYTSSTDKAPASLIEVMQEACFTVLVFEEDSPPFVDILCIRNDEARDATTEQSAELEQMQSMVHSLTTEREEKQLISGLTDELKRKTNKILEMQQTVRFNTKLILKTDTDLRNLQLQYRAMLQKYERPDLALFEQRSEESSEPEEQPKPPIRIIQHLSCTGGTLIAKCLASLPNVVLLGEVNPLSKLMIDDKPRFSPTDLTYLAVHGRFPLIDELSEKVFKAGIDVILDHVSSLGKYLVLRDHSHSDFLVGESARERTTVFGLLEENHDLLSLVTIRHPVDSYLSLLNSGWIHYTPGTFDEYCKRYLLFVEYNEDFVVYKYEDFVNDPQTQLQLMSESLQLPFNEDFREIFDVNILSGDSGRTSGIIEEKERREYDEKFCKEAMTSDTYLKLCEILNYDPSITDPNHMSSQSGT